MYFSLRFLYLRSYSPSKDDCGQYDNSRRSVDGKCNVMVIDGPDFDTEEGMAHERGRSRRMDNVV